MQTKLLIGMLTASGLVASTSLAQNPYARADDSWISLSGTITSTTPDSFMLDYGDGVIAVEMDDWDARGDAIGLLDGDRVTVYGRIDDDLYETAKIEAGSVFVESLGTFFYASSSDEEGGFDLGPYNHYWSAIAPALPGQATVSGIVGSVNEDQEQFTILTDNQVLTVETDELPYNPLDLHGFQRVESGDYVRVSGEFDRDFIDGLEFEASSVVTLREGSDS